MLLGPENVPKRVGIYSIRMQKTDLPFSIGSHVRHVGHIRSRYLICVRLARAT